MVDLSSIPADTREEIASRLSDVERQEDIRFLIAVESGSRAWGFPSPDSDFDVRFIYARPRDWYLSLKPGRHVIERPIVDEIDLSGWDISKALALMLNANAVVSEWLESPIRYRADDASVFALARLADISFDPHRTALHYASLAKSMWVRHLAAGEKVPVKKYFYALRPSLAIRALRMHPDTRPAMTLQKLVTQADVPATIHRIIEDLIEMKVHSNEESNCARFAEIDGLITAELANASEVPHAKLPDDLALQFDAAFRNILSR